MSPARWWVSACPKPETLNPKPETRVLLGLRGWGLVFRVWGPPEGCHFLDGRFGRDKEQLALALVGHADPVLWSAHGLRVQGLGVCLKP